MDAVLYCWSPLAQTEDEFAAGIFEYPVGRLEAEAQTPDGETPISAPCWQE